MAELMRLRKRHFVTEYHEEFDSIITRLNISVTYVLICFVGGLKKDVQMIVRMFQSPIVSRDFALARMYEAVNPVFNSNKNQRGVLGPAPTSRMGSQPNSHTKPKFQRKLTSTYMSERKAKGLCYFCDEPYSIEHSLVHKKLQIHVMEMDNDDITVDDTTGEEREPTQSAEPQISVNALRRVTGFRTMRITGYYQRKPMRILIDSGNTHNFLDVQVAKNYGCTIEQMQPLNVVAADGSKISISFMVKNFKWTIQHTTFTANMLLLPLGCCDLVLGIEWLIHLGDIIWNFDKLTMEFKVQGRRHVLRGATTNKVKMVKKQHFCKH